MRPTLPTPVRLPPCKRVLPGLLLCASPAALAHTGHATLGFAAGLAHPFTGVDHLLAMVAVGLWAAQPHGRPGIVWWLPAGFMAALVAGASVAMNGRHLAWLDAGLEPAIAASVLALGLLLVLALRLPLAVSVLLTASFGAVHGYAHGLELPQAASPVLYASGFLLATAALHLAGVGLGHGARRHGWAMRIMGGVIAASGVGLLSPL